MPKKHSPIRWDKIKDGVRFLRTLGLYDATVHAKMFFLFKDKNTMETGLSKKEISMILHPLKVQKDPATGEIFPTYAAHMQTTKEIQDFRKAMKQTGIILYCLTDSKTGAQIYFNITTLELFEKVVRTIERIIKGMRDNKNDALNLLRLSKKERNKIAKLHADDQRRELMKRLTEKLSKTRKDELAIIVRDTETKTTKKSSENEDDEKNEDIE